MWRGRGSNFGGWGAGEGGDTLELRGDVLVRQIAFMSDLTQNSAKKNAIQCKFPVCGGNTKECVEPGPPDVLPGPHATFKFW